MASKTYTLLSLGDSYTIGEGLALYESFPYQAVQLMRKAGYPFNAPEIIAKTGWTTDDLKKGIRNTMFQASYDFVTLLIGVNDQYQDKSVFEYATNFELVLKQAIGFAANNPSNVLVLSIPDWGQTPFAEGGDRAQISTEINKWNVMIEKLSKQYQVHYVAVTDETKAFSMNPAYLAADRLHPSKKEYARWAALLADEMQKKLV